MAVGVAVGLTLGIIVGETYIMFESVHEIFLFVNKLLTKCFK